MLAMLIGCRLGRGELLALRVDSLRLREEHWVVAGILGKAGHICSVPVPGWVKAATDEWKESRGHQKLSHAVNFNYSGKKQYNLALPFLPPPVKPTERRKGTNDRVSRDRGDDAHRRPVEKRRRCWGQRKMLLFSAV